MTFDIGLHEVCVRVGVRYVITKFSRMDSLPNFVTHGAPLCALRARELRYESGWFRLHPFPGQAPGPPINAATNIFLVAQINFNKGGLILSICAVLDGVSCTHLQTYLSVAVTHSPDVSFFGISMTFLSTFATFVFASMLYKRCIFLHVNSIVLRFNAGLRYSWVRLRHPRL